MKTTLFLARHGQTVWHAENRYAGVSDVDLTEVGRTQAAELAEWAAQHRPDVVVSSPVRRALETANGAAAAIGRELQIESKLAEMSFGIAEGKTMSELRELDPHMVQRFVANPVLEHFPDGEDPAGAAERGSSALIQLAHQHQGQTLLVVAHNTLLRLSLCRLIGVDVGVYRRLFPRFNNGCLTEISLDDGNDNTSSADTNDGGPLPTVSVRSLNVPLSTPRTNTP